MTTVALLLGTLGCENATHAVGLDASLAATGGSGGSAGADASLAPCDDGSVLPSGQIGPAGCYTMTSGGGTIGYWACPEYADAGLGSLTCTIEGGPPTEPVLTEFCKYEKEIAKTYAESELFLGCVGNTGIATPITPSVPPAVTLNPDVICDPGTTSALRACTDRLNVCDRAPICLEGGRWGCDDMVAACPALPLQTCRNGFNSRPYAARVRIHDCITQATGDCVDAFYHCAWGL